MAQLKLIRASAGSGKTFNLTRFFLEIVLNQSDTNYYKKILAVTFTNKATAEMKERILKELSILASGEKSDHLEELIVSTRKTEARIRNLSNAILNKILHGYSWFRVETIDTFFQGIIRSFVRELGIPGHYNIELDQEKILEEAVNRLLDKLEARNKLVNWIIQYVDSRISAGKSWEVKTELRNLGKSLFKEEFVDNISLLEPIITNSKSLTDYRNNLQSIVTEYEDKLEDITKSVFQAIESHGFVSDDFYFKGSGTLTYLKKLKTNPTELPGKRALDLLDNPDKWAPKKHDRILEIQTLGSTTLNPAFNKIIKIINEEGSAYISANVILKNLHILGLLTHLNTELKSLQREKGIMLISDASPFIQKIINNNDTPFIYEKAGNRFNHILIDEFQDTSSMQWGNFKPLISNSLSDNNDCLLVGDVKQSIYRWRNSNWEILAKKVKEEISQEVIKDTPLTTNWRSSARVVQYNNELFKDAAEIYQSLLPENNQLLPVTDIYEDVSQDTPKSKNEELGHVNIKLFDNKDTKGNSEYFAEELIERINELLANDYKPGDIAILVRNKQEGSTLASFIVNANKENAFSQSVEVISNESLFLSGSSAVNLLLAALHFVFNPEDRLISAALSNTYKQVFSQETEITDKPGHYNIDELSELISEDFIEQCKNMRMENLYAIAEKLISFLDIYSINEERVYIHSFLDVVFNFSTSELSELSGFLSYWTEEGHKKTISAAETPGSIRILTIHKSKGLEFPAVIVPFSDWSYTPKTGEKMWLKVTTEPFNSLPLAPINYEAALENSIFSEQFHEENYRTLIDNINLQYVAFTRARDVLVSFVRTNETCKDSGDVINLSLQRILSKNTIPDLKFIEDENRYILGSISKNKPSKSENNTRYFTKEGKTSELPEVRISSQAQRFMFDQTSKLDAAVHGQILHATMEKIKSTDDIQSAVQQMTLEGIIKEEEGKEVIETLNEAVKNPTVSDWFSKQNTILTETDIIGFGGKTNRPDRVVIANETVSIIDYKFGSDEEIDKHTKQVKNYKYLVNSMGYAHVKGFIWYVMENKIVEV